MSARAARGRRLCVATARFCPPRTLGPGSFATPNSTAGALDPAEGADSAATVEFGVAKLPGPSVLGGQNLAVAKHSRHPRAARALIAFLTGERSQQLLFERGGFAATREIVYRDAAVVKLYRYAPTLLEAIRSAHSRPVTAHYAQFSETFRQVVLEALADGGRLPPDAKPRLQRALQGYR